MAAQPTILAVPRQSLTRRGAAPRGPQVGGGGPQATPERRLLSYPLFRGGCFVLPCALGEMASMRRRTLGIRGIGQSRRWLPGVARHGAHRRWWWRGRRATGSTPPARRSPVATLGDDIYGVLCDRVGASSFTEDLTGASYASICHYDAAGHYGSTVDVSACPRPPPRPRSPPAASRSPSSRAWRSGAGDLVHALNATFPDVTMPGRHLHEPQRDRCACTTR